MRSYISGVYQYRNLLNDWRYVGSSRDMINRNNVHKNLLRIGIHHCRHLQHAWKLYGEDAFVFEILEEFEDCFDKSRSKDLEYTETYRNRLTDREQFFMDFYKDRLYNHNPVARSRLGSTQSEEFKKNASIRAKAYMSRSEIAEKYRQLRLGKTWADLFGVDESDRMKASISEKRTGQRLGISPPNKGVPLSDEHNIILQAARAAYVAEHGAWNAGTTWEEVFGSDVAAERKTEYARLADKWFAIDANRELHSEAMRKGTQERVEREGKHWKEGSIHSPEVYRATAITKGAPLYLFQGEHRTVSEIARMAKLDRATVRDRLAAGKSIEEATRPELSKGGAQLGHDTSEETKENISQALKSSDKSREFHDSCKGKPSKPSKSGEYGIKWLNDRKRFMVYIEGKRYGYFKEDDLEEAIKRRDEVLAMLAKRKNSQ